MEHMGDCKTEKRYTDPELHALLRALFGTAPRTGGGLFSRLLHPRKKKRGR
jgi:hypothetical protein